MTYYCENDFQKFKYPFMLVSTIFGSNEQTQWNVIQYCLKEKVLKVYKDITGDYKNDMNKIYDQLKSK